MDGRVVFAIPLLALAAASGPVQPQGELLDIAAARALTEARAAEAETLRFQKVADAAKNEADRLGPSGRRLRRRSRPLRRGSAQPMRMPASSAC